MKRFSEENGDEHVFLPPSVGRRKRSGSSALAVLGDGWGSLANEWGYYGMGPTNGPDVQLRIDVEAGAMWDGITRTEW